ncbi:Ribokinase-like protein [Paraphysoderma sedebokerense]|nr:Ribokinase-like protein [Paraphysoderma sedebokerense]
MHPPMIQPTRKEYDPKKIASKEILCVGLNPAFQTTLHFDNFTVSKVNRAFRKTHSIGGKGQNFVIACQQYGAGDKVSIAQFIGGMTGIYIEKVLEEKSIDQFNVVTNKPTRTCTTVLDFLTGATTELIEPSSRIASEEKSSMETLLTSLIHNSKNLKGIAVCGTYPSGIDGSTYEFIAKLKGSKYASNPKNENGGKSEECVLLLDAYKDIARALNTGFVNVLKINREEACLLSELPVEGTPITAIGKRILSMFKLDMLAITNGPDGALLMLSPTHYYIYSLPSLLSISLLTTSVSNSPKQSQSPSPQLRLVSNNKPIVNSSASNHAAKSSEIHHSSTPSSTSLSSDSTAISNNSLPLSLSSSSLPNQSELEPPKSLRKPKSKPELLAKLKKMDQVSQSAVLPSPVTVDRNPFSNSIPKNDTLSKNEKESSEKNTSVASTPLATHKPSIIDLSLSEQDQQSSLTVTEASSLDAATKSGESQKEMRRSPSLQDETERIVLNPLGAGDTCSGVFLTQLVEKKVSSRF